MFVWLWPVWPRGSHFSFCKDWTEETPSCERGTQTYKNCNGRQCNFKIWKKEKRKFWKWNLCFINIMAAKQEKTRTANQFTQRNETEIRCFSWILRLWSSNQFYGKVAGTKRTAAHCPFVSSAFGLDHLDRTLCSDIDKETTFKLQTVEKKINKTLPYVFSFSSSLKELYRII